MILFDDEKELQTLYGEYLEWLGYDVELEVSDGVGRIDILTDEHLIECKHYLTTDNGHKAHGQVDYYRRIFPSREPQIVCQEVRDENARHMAEVCGYRVIETIYDTEFMNYVSNHYDIDNNNEYEDDYYYEPTYSRSYSGSYSDYSGAGIAIVAVPIVLVVGLFFAAIVTNSSNSGNPGQSNTQTPDWLAPNQTNSLDGKFEPNVRIDASAHGYGAGTIRSGPGENYPKIAQFNNGTPLEKIEPAQAGWYQVEFELDGTIQNGWVFQTVLGE